jgi:PAS domain S-box-containing protein
LAGRVVGWNAGAKRLFGYAEEEALHRHLSVFYAPGEAIDGRADRDLEEAAARGSLRERRTLLRSGAETFCADLTVTPLSGQGGRPEGFAVVTRDLSERKRSDSERHGFIEREGKSRSDAEVASRAKDEFISILSHELRTPLTAILGWARMLRTRQGDPVFISRALDVIERNTKAQANLIEELVDISRIEKGTLELTVGPVEMSTLVAKVTAAVGPAAETKGVMLVTHVSADLGTLEGDADRLQQVLCNLLASSIKLTSAGGRIDLRIERLGEGVEISVTDTGAGIAPECLPFVFDVFRRAGGASPRRASGLGIGLAIVPLLVGMHGGTVIVESEGLGKGARFVVRLPQAGAAVSLPQPDGESPSHAEHLMTSLAH